MSLNADVVVVGLGAMGSAAAFHLAQRNKTVLGLVCGCRGSRASKPEVDESPSASLRVHPHPQQKKEPITRPRRRNQSHALIIRIIFFSGALLPQEQFAEPGHELGSSGGETRIIRMAYFEHPDYVAFLRRSYHLWDALEKWMGRVSGWDRKNVSLSQAALSGSSLSRIALHLKARAAKTQLSRLTHTYTRRRTLHVLAAGVRACVRGVRARQKVFYKTGGLDIGLPNSELVQGSLQSCRDHLLEHSLLSAQELSKRFPAFAAWNPNMTAVFQPDAGVLLPDECIKTHWYVRARAPICCVKSFFFFFFSARRARACVLDVR